MTYSQQRRLTVILIGLGAITFFILTRLLWVQLKGEYWADIAEFYSKQNVESKPHRGTIYDQNGTVLVGNTNDYQIGASPLFVYDKEEVATVLAPILLHPRYEILGDLEQDLSYVVLAQRVSAAVAEEVRALELGGIQIEALPRRMYPQGDMMCHLLGYTDFEGQGGSGVEGYYQRELAGSSAEEIVSISPLASNPGVIAHEGADLVLTIDRTIQSTVERHLAEAIRTHRASGGTIIVMDPKTGGILAMASAPCFSPYNFYEFEPRLFSDPAVSRQYEPGSVMKLLTTAAGIDAGIITPDTTYNDTGILDIAGSKIYNWDLSAPGTTDMTTMLARSLNVGAGTVALWLGADQFYEYMIDFGFMRLTGIDLAAEATGQMLLPGDPLWTEADLVTNSFGQGLAVTPLQMVSSASAIANDGKIMQPYVVKEIHTEDRVIINHPTIASQPISAKSARIVSSMATTAVYREVPEAQVSGYTIAGKTGTAQIPEGGVYHETDVIASFIGWVPADAPEIIVLVKLDRPQSAPWGSKTAAPTFARLVEELVVLMNIPPDQVRLPFGTGD